MEIYRMGRLVVFLHDTLERMFVPSRKVQHLGYLGLGNLICIDPAQTDALLVDVKHDAGRLLAGAVEEPLEDEHDEFHRRVIIIEKENAVERGLLGLDAGFGGQVEACAAVIASAR